MFERHLADSQIWTPTTGGADDRVPGRAAVATGGGRGLGSAYGRLLAERGAQVVLHDTGAGPDGQGEDAAVVDKAAAGLRSEGLSATAASGAIDNPAGCLLLVREALARHGRLGIIINNAGWVGYQRIEELEPVSLARALALQVEGPLWLAQAAWPAVTKQGYGRTLLATSDRALYPQYAQAGRAAYAASKAAQAGVMNVLALEGAEHGTVVNAISPVAKTRMWGVEGEPDELRPQAVAAGAAWLVPDACTQSGWVLRASNGQFHAVRPAAAAGVDCPRDLRAVAAGSPDAVAAMWDRIAVEHPEARA